MVNRLKRRAVKVGVVEKIRAFRDLSHKLRRQTSSLSQTPSYILIREDRDGGHRDA